MDREKLIESLKTAEPMDQDIIMSIVKQSIDANCDDYNPRGHHNLIICIEELSELTKELTKVLRGKENPIGLLEEFVHAKLCLLYIQEICNIQEDDIQKMISVTMSNTKTTLEQTNRYQ